MWRKDPRSGGDWELQDAELSAQGDLGPLLRSAHWVALCVKSRGASLPHVASQMCCCEDRLCCVNVNPHSPKQAYMYALNGSSFDSSALTLALVL